MTQHYTRNTVSAAAWCKKCGKQTQHRVDDVKLGPCLECIFRAEAQKVGVPLKVSDGELMVQCSDATFEYLNARVNGKNAGYLAPLLCTCPQREFPHELSVHALLRREAHNPKLRFRWPWYTAFQESGPGLEKFV